MLSAKLVRSRTTAYSLPALLVYQRRLVQQPAIDAVHHEPEATNQIDDVLLLRAQGSLAAQVFNQRFHPVPDLATEPRSCRP
jgi:hypothetical protein